MIGCCCCCCDRLAVVAVVVGWFLSLLSLAVVGCCRCYWLLSLLLLAVVAVDFGWLVG